MTPATDARDPSAIWDDRRHAHGCRAERRPLDDEDVIRPERQPRDVVHVTLAWVDVVPVERPVGLGMERPQPTDPGEFEMAEPAVRARLEQQRMRDRA